MAVIWGIVQTDNGPVRVSSDEELIAALKQNEEMIRQWRENIRTAVQEYMQTSAFNPFIVPAKD